MTANAPAGTSPLVLSVIVAPYNHILLLEN